MGSWRLWLVQPMGCRVSRNYVEPIFVKYHLTKPASMDALKRAPAGRRYAFVDVL